MSTDTTKANKQAPIIFGEHSGLFISADLLWWNISEVDMETISLGAKALYSMHSYEKRVLVIYQGDIYTQFVFFVPAGHGEVTASMFIERLMEMLNEKAQ